VLSLPRKRLIKLIGSKAFIGYLFVIPGTTFVFLLTVYPMARTIWMSFFNLAPGKHIFIGSANYADALKDGVMWLSLSHSVFFTGISVIAHFLIGLGLALLLNNPKIKGEKIFKSLLLIPWLFPSAVVAITWQLIFHPRFSILNAILIKLGLSGFTRMWLAEDSLLPLSCVTLINSWKAYAFHMVVLFAGLKSIPRQLYEVAEIDGASEFKKFLFVTLPGLRPLIITVLTLDTIWTFIYFDLVYLVTRGGPMLSSEVLPTYLYRIIFKRSFFGYGSTLAVIMMLFMVVFALLSLWITIKEEFKS